MTQTPDHYHEQVLRAITIVLEPRVTDFNRFKDDFYETASQMGHAITIFEVTCAARAYAQIPGFKTEIPTELNNTFAAKMEGVVKNVGYAFDRHKLYTAYGTTNPREALPKLVDEAFRKTQAKGISEQATLDGDVRTSFVARCAADTSFGVAEFTSPAR